MRDLYRAPVLDFVLHLNCNKRGDALFNMGAVVVLTGSTLLTNKKGSYTNNVGHENQTTHTATELLTPITA